MSEKYYVGSYRDDAMSESSRGWLVGTFKESLPRKSDEVEIKYWEFGVGANDHPLKESAIIECTFILTGKTRAIIDDQELLLGAGDYVVIHPGTKNNLVMEIVEPTTGLTIKAPSDPTAKKVLE